MATPNFPHWLTMHFAAQLVRLRKQRNWTQQTLADALDINLTQIKRHETGASQPSLEALKKIAITLKVSLDELVFGNAERGPDEALKLKFEALAKASRSWRSARRNWRPGSDRRAHKEPAPN